LLDTLITFAETAEYKIDGFHFPGTSPIYIGTIVPIIAPLMPVPSPSTSSTTTTHSLEKNITVWNITSRYANFILLETKKSRKTSKKTKKPRKSNR
jgi:hypothetical protein